MLSVVFNLKIENMDLILVFLLVVNVFFMVDIVVKIGKIFWDLYKLILGFIK